MELNFTDEIRSLIPRGFEVIGAVVVHDKNDVKLERVALDAISAVGNLRKSLYGSENEDRVLIGGVLDLNNGGGEHDLQFFVSGAGSKGSLEKVGSVVYEDQPEKKVWEKGCLVRCELPTKLPMYYASNSPKGEFYAIVYLLDVYRLNLRVEVRWKE